MAKLFGAFLMAVGGLIAVLSGLCSMGFIGVTVLNLIQHPSRYATDAPEAARALTLTLLFGGVPIGIGVVLFIAGRNLFRGK